MIINGKGKEGNKTAGPEVPYILQVMQVFDAGIGDYKDKIIEVERTKEGVGINKGP
jgi:hypothetical protein